MSILKKVKNLIGLKDNPLAATDSGFTASYTDPSTGLTLPNAWIQIRQINYVPEQYCLVVTDVYTDESSYEEGKQAVFSNVVPEITFGSQEWGIYFDPSVSNILPLSLDFLQEKF